jgi:pyruvyltransferase
VRVSASWCVSSNVGDCLTPYLIKKITGLAPMYAQGGADYEHYVFAGSMLNHATPHSVVWGAGLASMLDGVNPDLKIKAVRGPISRMRAINCGATCPKVYGDPAILLPKFYKPKVAKAFDVGVVPHYVDHLRVYARYIQGEKIIDPLQSVESFVDEIVSCERIISSSLHGVIIAHAYGIPAVWAKFSDSIGGDGTKYRDYFQSVDWDVDQPINMVEKSYIPEIPLEVPNMKRTQAMLWDACPIPKESRLAEWR